MEKYRIRNLDCASCAARVEEGVRKLEDVRFVSVNFAAESITLDTGNLEKVRQKIKEIEPGAELEEFSNKKRLITAGEIAENRRTIFRIAAGLLLLTGGLLFREELRNTPYRLAEFIVFGLAYLITGWNVLALAVKNILNGQVFSEYFLMTIATLGAIAIGELPEAVAVMLFYVVGEFFQDLSVGRSRRSIRSLLELKPDFANLWTDNRLVRVSPEEVKPGDVIAVRAGEKIPLDGIIADGESFVDTSALTGESVPRRVRKNDEVLSGMINQSGMLKVSVTRSFDESSISRILELVENASARKAGTEKFITTFARYYTPAVVFTALLLATLPPLLIAGQSFDDWIYRALVVLVVSCPCALVISIPLGYFGGIGAASRRGILVKGSNFLDALTKVRTVVFDKTGTLTKGEFKVSDIVPSDGYSKNEVLEYAALAEAHSGHPIARSVLEAAAVDASRLSTVRSEEISGHGMKTIAGGRVILAGNGKLMHREGIDFNEAAEKAATVVYVAADGKFVGSIAISDSLKPDSAEAIKRLKAAGIETIILTGDNQTVTEDVASRLKVDRYYWGLLPEDKVSRMEMLMKENHKGKIAFAGDGINDAPVLARADVGIAMGALGSDAAVETADVVLMTDAPLKVGEAIELARKTRAVVWQNIIFALGVKLIFIVLGIAGVATMWEAVFGDMGVALIAVFNAMRILRSK